MSKAKTNMNVTNCNLCDWKKLKTSVPLWSELYRRSPYALCFADDIYSKHSTRMLGVNIIGLVILKSRVSNSPYSVSCTFARDRRALNL